MATLPKKKGAFFDWYNEVLDQTQVTDKRYPVKGLNVWPAFGTRLRRHMDHVLRTAVEAIGYEEVSFPTLIPETELKKESDHIKGFESQVYWVTHGGTTPLDVRLCLRPTSETAMYPIFALWVRSHKDLPLRTFQIVNTFRYETKSTRPLIRVREIHFFEGHTVQKDEAAATKQVEDDLASFAAIAHELALPYLVNRRPEWDKFPGAHYSLALDTPYGDSSTLQVGTVHHYRDNFAKPYGIRYEAEDGSQVNGHQTTYGLSERLLGAVIGVHGDDQGLVLPPAIAAWQVVVIPVLGSGAKESVEAAARRVVTDLQAAGLRVKLDDRDERPGAKYYAWESRGVPLRVELGPREVQEGTFTLATRFGAKRKVPAADLVGEVRQELSRFRDELAKRAEARFREAISVAHAPTDLKGGTPVHLLGWCGQESCGHAIEQAVDGALLGTVERASPAGVTPGEAPPCLICHEKSSRWAAASQPL